ncbi:MAG: pyridoxal phosphate-dependent aminotransferase [Candidatus Rariloculaceae bacterium]
MNLRLAQRVQRIRPSTTVSITGLAVKLREEGKDIIALSVGEPDFSSPSHVSEAACKAIQDGNTKYTAIDGARSLKAAIRDKFRRDNDLDFDIDQIIVSNGGKQSCYNACQALLEAGDEVIIPSPYWVSFPEMVRLTNAEPTIVRTRQDQGFRMSANQFKTAITERTRALIINSPSNPTGSVYTRSDWHALAAVLEENPRIFVITDDIYEHIYWGEKPFCSLLTACPELSGRVLTVNGVSKCYSMTGWRIGYAAGPIDLITAMTTIQSQSTTSPSTISQAAACAALTGDQSFVKEKCEIFRKRHSMVVEQLNELKGFECQPADGAFYVFPNIQEAIEVIGVADDVQFCERLLTETGVALVPGSAFGAANHLRFSFAADLDTLEKALDRMKTFLAA